MHALEDAFPWLESRDSFASTKNNSDKVIVFERGTSGGPLVFAFNFHPTCSYTEYRVGVPSLGKCVARDVGDYPARVIVVISSPPPSVLSAVCRWVTAIDSDASEFAGYSRIDSAVQHSAEDFEHCGRPASILAYLPSRTAVVYKKLLE